MPQSAKQPLKVGIDGRELYPDLLTGIGRYLRNFLFEAVPAYPDCCFTVYGNQHTALDLQAPNLTLKIIPETLTGWWDQISLVRALRQDGPDVLLSPYEKGPYLAPCPVVLTVHDLLFYEISDRGPLATRIYNLSHRILRGPLIRRAARVITDSLYSQNDIAQKLNVPGENIRPVPIGIPSSYRPVRDPARIEAFKKAHDIGLPYLLYVGNFKPHKNVIRLLEAYAGLSENLKSAHLLVLCGRKDHHREAIRAQAQHLGIAQNVRFLDFVDDADMPVLYSGAQLFTFPSLYEGFGLPPLEAMACGTPVVSSGATSLAEVVQDAGVVVDARDPQTIRQAIESVLTRPDLQDNLIEAGLEQASKFTLEAAAAQIMQTLSEAVTPPASKTS